MELVTYALLKKKIEEMSNVLSSSEKSCIYCWGDSLTQGEGSNIKLVDDVFKAYNMHPYTDELTNYNVVNLGCQGETVNTIMARQGANPMVVSGITIPATKTPVIIGNKTDGIRTLFGDVARPLAPMEAGINPCYIGGIEGILHRGSSINDSDDNYYFTRLKPGVPVTLESDTIIDTFAMMYYRNGIAVIWMGSNGGYKDLPDYITKIKSMVTYGQYVSYIVIVSREFSGIDVEILKNEFTDANGLCHVINLYEELPLHGLSLANMTHCYFDTSDYANGDEILLKAPILCECTIVDGSPKFSPLHFSAYGNKAIGKIVSSKLEEVVLNTPKELFPNIPFYETDSTDKYGTVLWKLTKNYSSSGDQIIDTQWKPYDTEKNWTIVMKFTEPLTAVNTYGSIFESRDEETGTSVFFRKYTNGTDDVYMINMGKGVGFQFTTTSGFFEWVGGEPSTDGYHYLVLSKNGDNYCIFYDGSAMNNYGAPLGESKSDLTLTLFARQMSDGSVAQYSKGIINEFRIYDRTFSPSECNAIYSDMVNRQL